MFFSDVVVRGRMKHILAGVTFAVVASHTHALSALRSLQAPASTYNYMPMWNASATSSSVLAGYEYGTYGTPIYVCRGTLPNGDVISGKRSSYFAATTCNVPVNGTEYTATTSGALVKDPALWWGRMVPANATRVAAGTYQGQPSYVCRAAYPYLSNGPHAGHTTGMPTSINGTVTAPTCTIAYGGKAVLITSGSFDYLYAVPIDSASGLPSVNTTGGVPVVPSSSPTPTPSRTPSPSPTPAQPGVIRWVNATGMTTAGVLAAAVPLAAGKEEDGFSNIYVCAGYLSNGDVVPGKYESSWGFCDIPYLSNGTEVESNDRYYEVLANSPWLVWSASTTDAPVAGALQVIPGTYRGRNASVCRAWHPTRRSGPHAGFTDGAPVTIPGSGYMRPACLFSYGGGVVHAPAFDFLWQLPASANLSLAMAAARPVPQPSLSPTPSQTPTPSPSPSSAAVDTVTWMDEDTALASGYGLTNYIKAGSEGVNNDIYVCRGQLSNGDVLAGKWETNWNFCDIPSDGAEVNDAAYQLLVRSPYLVWSSSFPLMVTTCTPSSTSLPAAPSSTTTATISAAVPVTGAASAAPVITSSSVSSSSPAASAAAGSSSSTSVAPVAVAVPSSMQRLIPAGALPVVAGVYLGGNVTVCRAWHPTQLTGPHAGYMYTNSSNTAATACTFSWGGGVVSAFEFDVLYLVSQAVAANITATAPPLPSRSPTPSTTPSPSSSMAAPSPGQVQWLPGAMAVDAVRAGADGASSVYVCRGILPSTGEVVPGKWLPGWSFCDLAIRGVEFNDPNFELLRNNVRHTWVAYNATGSVPVGGSPVVGGTYQGLPATVCRAYHPVYKTGPHAGYSDGELYNGIPLCFFSWGGKIVRTAPFDYLYVMPPPSATPTPSTTASITGTPVTSTPTPTVSPSGTSTGTPSVTPTLPITGSGTGTPTITPSGTGSKSVAATASTTGTPSPTGSGTGTGTPSPTPSPSKPASAGLNSGSSDGSSSGPSGATIGVLAVVGVAAAGFLVVRARLNRGGSTGGGSSGGGEGDRVHITASPADEWQVDDARFQYAAVASTSAGSSASTSNSNGSNAYGRT